MQNLGVSVAFIQNFIQEHLVLKKPPPLSQAPTSLTGTKTADPKSHQSKREPTAATEANEDAEPEELNMNMFELCETVIKPLTHTKQLRFVELHHGKVDPGGKPYVKEANVFVSYPWSVDVRVMLNCLLDYANLIGNKINGNKDIYFWIDAFVVNQNIHSSSSHDSQMTMSPEDLEDYCDSTVRGCGNVVQVLTNWSSPVAFKRLWCVWECFIADRASIPITFVLPREEIEELMVMLIEKGTSSTNLVSKQLFNIDTRNAEATLLGDQKMLQTAIEKYVGFAKLNEVIKQQLRKHLIGTLKHRLQMRPEINNDPTLLSRFGNVISNLSIYDTEFLVNLFKKCLALFQELGKDQWNPETVMCYTNLGAVCRKGNLNEDALNYLFQALHLEEKRIVIERRKISNVLADIYFQIGGTYLQIGKYSEALEVLLNANEIYTQMGEENETTIRTQRKIAGIYNKLGMYGIANKIYADIIANSSNVHSIPIALARSAYGDTLVNEGSHHSAVVQVTTALEVLSNLLGEESSLVTLNYNKRGEIYRQQGKLMEALQDQNRALETLKRMFGKGHPKTGLTLGYIAAIENEKGNFEEALDMYMNALDILSEFSTEDMSVEQSITNNNIAGVLMKLKKYDKALSYLTTALAIRTKILGDDHSDISSIYFDIAKCHWAMQEKKEAVNFCSKCLEIELRSLGEKHPQIGTTFCLLGDFYSDMRKYEPAHEAYKNAYAIWAHSLQYNHPQLTTLKQKMENSLTQVNAKERRKQELKEAAKPSMKIQIRLSGILKPSTQSVYYSIAKLYDQHEHSQEALAMYRKFLKQVQFALPSEHPRVVTAKKRIRKIENPQDEKATIMNKPRPYLLVD